MLAIIIEQYANQSPHLDTPEFPDYAVEFARGDSIPATLEPLFAHIAEELFPELDDKLSFLDSWIGQRIPATATR